MSTLIWKSWRRYAASRPGPWAYAHGFYPGHRFALCGARLPKIDTVSELRDGIVTSKCKNCENKAKACEKAAKMEKLFKREQEGFAEVGIMGSSADRADFQK